MKKQNQIKIMTLFALFFCFQWFAQLAVKKLSGGESPFYLLIVYGGFFLRSLIWVELLRDLKLITAYSISSLSYLIIPLLSWFVLGETYDLNFFIGGVLILTGISLFSVGDQKETLYMEEVH
ncbi:hypothetical protein EXM22_02380 [Oceanispirochaeta crateris]|uniref:EamA domain-containing protein n=1 Tax=Oceanispirochaeta crateris TaxID=2518645 RepID=A0A5C1QFR0_9SPIO|nr:EamA family transporter [Oceanispirochaeta crateris]QEN06895.1 hypothetical protein EXM22_02380 [Oceanispirochaeta crateris]